MKLGDVVDQFHDNDGLAHAAPNAPTLRPSEGADQINDFDAGGEHLGRCRLLHEPGWRAVDGIVFLCRPAFVHRLPASRLAPSPFPNGHGDRPGVDDLAIAFELPGPTWTRCGPSCRQAYSFERQVDVLIMHFVIDSQRGKCRAVFP
jgi:hypothetical protein